jgi:hypothetical protein
MLRDKSTSKGFKRKINKKMKTKIDVNTNLQDTFVFNKD